jgi:hypothetical protein
MMFCRFELSEDEMEDSQPHTLQQNVIDNTERPQLHSCKPRKTPMILHGNAGHFGKYAVLAFLPDIIARFLYEYHDTSYASLGLPSLPQDRIKIHVHGILQPQQVGP